MSHFQILCFDFDEPNSRGVFYAENDRVKRIQKKKILDRVTEKIAKKAQFSHLDEARDQMVGKTYSEPATTSSLFFSLSNET